MVDMAPSAVLAAANLDKLPLVDSGTNEPHDEGPKQPEGMGSEGSDYTESAGLAEDEIGTTSDGSPNRQEQKVVDTRNMLKRQFDCLSDVFDRQPTER